MLSDARLAVIDLIDKYSEQVEIGKEIEREHLPTLQKLEKEYDIDINDEEFFRSIAIDHEREMIDYYDRLMAMEDEFEKEKTVDKKSEGLIGLWKF